MTALRACHHVRDVGRGHWKSAGINQEIFRRHCKVLSENIFITRPSKFEVVEASSQEFYIPWIRMDLF